MADLVRFHDWVIDRNEISNVNIKSVDGKEYDNEFAKITHIVVLELKSGQKFQLHCSDLYDARKALNHLTASCKTAHIGSDFDNYLMQQIYHSRQSIIDQSEEIKNLTKKIETLNRLLKKQGIVK